MAISRKLLADLKKRRESAALGGGADKLDAVRAKGRMAARDRVAALFDPETLQEFGLLTNHDCHHFGMEKKSLPTDGVITGVGQVDGRPVAVFSQDFSVAGGSVGRIHSQKIVDLMEFALHGGMPVVGFNDSGGARIQEGVESLSGYGRIFFKNVFLSGVVPQIAVIAGPCAGGAAYSPALMDFSIMVRDTANMFICGPDVIKAATGEKATMEEVGSAEMHASVTGNIHFLAENDQHAVEIVQKLLSFLPLNNVMDPPHFLETPLETNADPGINELIPDDPKQPFNVLDVIQRIVDDSDFLEVHSEFAKNLVVGFARICGVVVGIVANQPMVKAGTLDIDSSDKGARFIRFCNIFNIPLVSLVDIPGYMPGLVQERGGIIRHGAKMLFAYGASTVPKITLIMRKAYGGAYLAMCSSDLGADLVIAWPTAEIAVMGAEGAVKILYKREVEQAADKRAKEAELVTQYREEFASPYQAASLALIDDVIDPADTRKVLARSLRNTLAKRETRPPKKHGNIPL
jgi:propionyl-CoA carboxylase beta chain